MTFDPSGDRWSVKTLPTRRPGILGRLGSILAPSKRDRSPVPLWAHDGRILEVPFDDVHEFDVWRQAACLVEIDGMSIHAALSRDLTAPFDPLLSICLLRLVTNRDMALHRNAVDALARHGPRLTPDLVIEVCHRVPRDTGVPDRWSIFHAYPSTRLLAATHEFATATDCDVRDFEWLKRVDPRLWAIVFCAVVPNAMPFLGLAAGSHWLAERVAGVALPSPRLEMPTRAMIAHVANLGLDRPDQFLDVRPPAVATATPSTIQK